MAYHIGLDWGARKIGVAFGEDESKIAFADRTIENNQHVYEFLCEISEEYDAKYFVIGMTAHSALDDNQKAIKAFAKKLEECTRMAIIFSEEMMSTREAHTNLKAAGKKKIAGKDDAEAARIILQNYFDHL